MLILTAVLMTAAVFGSIQENPRTQRIVAASGVRMRAAPSTNAPELTRLSLGTVLTETEKSLDGAWSRVTSSDGTTGWVFANLTESFDDRDSEAAYLRIVRSRLKAESIGFAEATDLFRLLDRVIPGVKGSALPELELLRLRALNRSLKPIVGYEPKDPAHRDWVKQHEKDLAYNEPAGDWLVRAELYWQLEAKHRGHPMADYIAWEAASTGVPGECEGHIACYLSVIRISDGRYLELYPAGAHAAEALDHIDYLLQEATAPEKRFEIDPQEVSELGSTAVELTRILERTTDPRRAEMIRRLKQIPERYR